MKTLPPSALSVEQALALTGLGRTKLYQLMGDGKLPARKVGKRTVILRSDLEAFLADLQPYKTDGGAA